jgi:hypothetical protein
MAIFLESPWPILSIGITVELVLAILLWRTGQGRVLWAMLGTLGVVLLGFLLQWLVVTDREAIDNLLHDCAAAAEANDIPRLLGHISPSAKDVQTDIQTVLGRVEVTMARIIDLKITVNRQVNPREAKASFTAIAKGRDRKGEFPAQAYACKLIVDLRRENIGWRIADYHDEELKLP